MGFDWHFGADDQLSDKAERMARALEKLEAASEKLTKALEGMDSKQEKAARSHESFATTLHSTIEVGLRVAEVFERLGEGIYEVGKSFVETGLDAAMFKETAMVSLSTMLGSDSAAQSVIKRTVGLASKLPIQTGEVMSAASNFLMAGYKEEDLVPLITGMADIKALNGERGAFASEMFLRQIREIHSTGLNSRHLMALSNETGLPEDAVLGKLSKMYGWGNIDAEGAKKRLGEVNREDAVVAILDVLRDKEGGELGNLSNKLSETVPGLYSTLKSRKLETFMDLNNSEGYAKYKGFLSNLVKLSDPNSDFATRLKGGIERTFNGLFDVAFGDLSGDGGLKNMENLLDRLLAAGEGFADGFGSAMRGLLDDSNSVFKTGPLSKEELDRIKWDMEDFGRGVGSALRTVIKMFEDLGSAAKQTWGYMEMVGKYFNGTAHTGLEEHPEFFKGAGDSEGPRSEVPVPGQDEYLPPPLLARATQEQQPKPHPYVYIDSVHIDAKGHPDEESIKRKTKDAVAQMFEEIAQQTGGLGI